MAAPDRIEARGVGAPRGQAIAGGLAAAAVLAIATGSAAQPLPPLPPEKPPPAPLAIERPANISPAAPRTTTTNSITFLLAKAPVAGVRDTWNVDFREEATQPDYATLNGGGSASGSAAIDCDRRQFQLRSFTLFSASNLHGQTVLQLYARTQWQTPGPATLIWRVVALTCMGPDRNAPSPVAGTASQSDAASSRPETPVGVRNTHQGGYWVQVGISPSVKLAQALLTKLDAAGLLRGEGREVREAQVRRAKTFRSLVGAFPERHAAAQFCESLSSQGHPCFVRAD